MRVSIMFVILAILHLQAAAKKAQWGTAQINKAMFRPPDLERSFNSISHRVGWFKIENGLFGDLKKEVIFPKDFYACGAQIKYDATGSLETTVNGLRFKVCKRTKEINSWNIQVNIQVYEGNWGEWKETAMCPENSYINGIQIKFEDYRGIFRDDTALNGIQLKCNHEPTPLQKTSDEWLQLLSGSGGNWKTPIYFPHFNVCGARARYDDPAALKGLELLFCKARVLKAMNIDYLWDRTVFNIQTKRTNNALQLNNTNSSKMDQKRELKTLVFDINYGWNFDEDYFFDMNTRSPITLDLAKVTNKASKTFHKSKKRPTFGLVPNQIIEDKETHDIDFRVFAAPGQCMNRILLIENVNISVPFIGELVSEDGIKRKVSGNFSSEYVHNEFTFLNEEC